MMETGLLGQLVNGLLAAIVGGIISAALEVIPGLRAAWDKVSKEWKALVLLLLFAGLAPLLLFLVCYLGLLFDLLGGGCPATFDAMTYVNWALYGAIAWFSSQVTFASTSSKLGKRLD